MTGFKSSWKPLALPELRRLPSPVYVRVQSLAPRHRFPMHRHRWHQLIYAISGSMTIAVQDHWVVVSPEQAIWIPAGVEHAVGSTHGAEFRSLYIDAKTRVAMPSSGTVVKITPLMRELILEAAGIGTKADTRAYRTKVTSPFSKCTSPSMVSTSATYTKTAACISRPR